MKKKLALLLVTAMGIISLAACGSKSFTCGLCGEEKTGTRYTSKEDEEMVICKDCYDMVNELFEGMN